MVGYFAEVLQIRETLDNRYDELKSGKVKPIPGAEVEAHFGEKSAAARSKTGFRGADTLFIQASRDDLDEIWDYIAADNLDAADRVITEILGDQRTLSAGFTCGSI